MSTYLPGITIQRGVGEEVGFTIVTPDRDFWRYLFAGMIYAQHKPLDFDGRKEIADESVDAADFLLHSLEDR